MPAHNPEQVKLIKKYIDKGFTNPEIAKILGITKCTVALLSTRWLNGNPNYLKRVSKHAHIREDVFKYFLDHTFFETKQHFKLTDSELKSLMTVGYRLKELKQYRKDNRKRDLWTDKQIKASLQMAGLLPRNEIAQKIGRDNARVIKEKWMALRVSNPKTINGMTLTQFKKLFNCNPKVIIHTKAGPGRGACIGSTFFKIIPWVWIQDALAIGSIECDNLHRSMIQTKVAFQKWIHDNDVYKSIFKFLPEESIEIVK